MLENINKELLSFLKDSPTCFHAVAEIKKQLDEAGFTQLDETTQWNLTKNGKYYTIRNGSSIIAFHIGKDMDNYHFQLTAAHSDSPTYKVKENAELAGQGGYLQLNTEGYGGMLAASWFDRPLSLAGRIVVKEGNTIQSKLLKIDRDILVIPNVAIHLNRDANNGIKYNNQVDLLPLFSAGELQAGDYYKFLAAELGVKREDILGSDMFLYNRDNSIEWGVKDEFISSPRLDNLQCSFASLKGFMNAENTKSIAVYACFDNEEVGSSTKQGAGSTFLYDVLQRINLSLGYENKDYYSAIAKSFMLSCDNAHAVHPNHPELTDKKNCAYLNKGIVIKYNANQRYTTDAISNAVFTDLCNHFKIPYQHFANRSDMVGGSSLGNISSTKVSMNAVDLGLPQLAMHSAYETAGSKDTAYLVEAIKHFFESDIRIDDVSKIEVNYK
ncbi:aspartyl aminopeptidase [Breznakia sp. PF5-3]|uniref:M18 family aminopeptidase n=1 Tax=unclassified Breznakia TaxID=2623764 RepID=UPI002406B24A|nr:MULTISPECIES: M18 family aminopeptidase [unclassified Breznakia]MDF9825244.1 aspartyl aminopeptidase [Breznakia sp. PM6-1]MDF9836114.1 aspartyl aminopeptidase [Breznakia sp. PF5-3]MDF9838397.1 aspartyl aminopeptidase [Breznakia sp. PFB2-8]MDF9860413.1 aspartyl aminopeptidase [Breznakia sp. PH5-24]